MTVNYEELKRKATEANKKSDGYPVALSEHIKSRAEFWRAANPATVLEMIKDREEMLAALDKIYTGTEDDYPPFSAMSRERMCSLAGDAIKQAKAGAV